MRQALFAEYALPGADLDAGAAAVAGLPMPPILVVSILGAVIGDGISFWLG